MPGLHDLQPAEGARKQRTRRGRGDAANRGSYSGRGHKGQKKRGSVRRGFEGGQLPIIKRMPYLRGFKNPFRVSYIGVNLDRLNIFAAGTEVTHDVLREAGIITKWDERVKLLARGTIDRPLKITAHTASKQAIEKIAAAGGTVTLLNPPKPEAPVAEEKPPKASAAPAKAKAKPATSEPAEAPAKPKAKK